MCGELIISNFGGAWSLQREDLYWLPIHYSYRHYGGGHNGCEIAVAWVSEYGEVVDFESKLF
jgi:hypothetical protein